MKCPRRMVRPKKNTTLTTMRIICPTSAVPLLARLSSTERPMRASMSSAMAAPMMTCPRAVLLIRML
jgi:hypothetical protein